MFTRYYKLKDLLFGRYLWVTNTVSCGILLTAGDVIQQRIELFTNSSQTNDSIDVDRIGKLQLTVKIWLFVKSCNVLHNNIIAEFLGPCMFLISF